MSFSSWIPLDMSNLKFFSFVSMVGISQRRGTRGSRVITIERKDVFFHFSHEWTSLRAPDKVR